MAITGTGTEQDPFVVHSYSEFISLSGHIAVSNGTVYIQFFDTPNQILDCNTYGADFKWGHFGPNAGAGAATFYINLNGCTIKNIMVADGATMFEGIFYSAARKIIISNGSILNVFMGSATSKICGDYVEFHNVSISTNVAGTTTIPFGNNSDNNSDIIMDNCALYLQASTLYTSLMKRIVATDTDMELYVSNQNGINMFPDCSFTDCRVQGKVSGNTPYYSDSSVIHHTVLGAITRYYDGTPITNWVNCVVDLDLTESTTQRQDGVYHIIWAYSGGINTNVMCKSHFPAWSVPSDWNYMTHEQIRNGEYLNSKGFTVVEVVRG